MGDTAIGMTDGLAVGRSIRSRSHHTRMWEFKTMFRGREQLCSTDPRCRMGVPLSSDHSEKLLAKLLQEQPEWVPLLQATLSRMEIYQDLG